MRVVSDWSIRIKVLAAFGAVLIITAALGTFALERLNAINQTAAEMRNNWLPATRLLGGMATNVERLRLNQAISASTTLDTRRQDTIKKSAGQIQLFQSNFERYKPLVSTDEEERLADAIAVTFDRYAAFNTELFAMLKSNPTQAAAFVDAQQALMDDLRGALQADIAYNVREGDKAGVRGESLENATHQWILIALGITAVLCVTLGWSMTRGISGPVTRMTAAMGRLAQHDMTVEIDGTKRGDEIGAMARAVQIFKDNMIEAARLGARRARNMPPGTVGRLRWTSIRRILARRFRALWRPWHPPREACAKRQMPCHKQRHRSINRHPKQHPGSVTPRTS